MILFLLILAGVLGLGAAASKAQAAKRTPTGPTVNGHIRAPWGGFPHFHPGSHVVQNQGHGAQLRIGTGAPLVFNPEDRGARSGGGGIGSGAGGGAPPGGTGGGSGGVGGGGCPLSGAPVRLYGHTEWWTMETVSCHDFMEICTDTGRTGTFSLPHPLFTRRGLVAISKINLGDFVVTEDGEERVESLTRRSIPNGKIDSYHAVKGHVYSAWGFIGHNKLFIQ